MKEKDVLHSITFILYHNLVIASRNTILEILVKENFESYD